jgi:hypothetical protein
MSLTQYTRHDTIFLINKRRRSADFWVITPCSPLKVNQRYAVISQKSALFITTAERTSSPTNTRIFMNSEVETSIERSFQFLSHEASVEYS